ncbi:conserved hypothetical protein [Cellulomonas flavigena DSM 20109]|uniref:Uncharacterized protein n=1 Tax=Cellulomonas flavigena (strain ATCC 482 / DSM 20109 / BCRC 11376 / JCM 18109 / NBRC 3775 / NCIMB 8073 / NRS 134) TaxID=446466 RepID=D5ULE4_CELFN|nr:hypothetical protein [Cellulomonas flavigena]ADG73986.1 conserved hypothetical protein [Cellulomonas flavigena DSM 20109]
MPRCRPARRPAAFGHPGEPTRTTKKKTNRVVLATGALTLLAGGIAFAYWTAGGSGTGEAGTGTTAPLTANQTSTVSDMGPGIGPQPLSGTFTNPNEGPVYVATVTASIAAVVDVNGDPVAGCSTEDYTLTGEVMTVNAEVDTGDTWGGATIAFANDAARNQDACKGATVELAYAVS